MKKYTVTELKAEFSRLGYQWFDFHTIGIRSKANAPNKFDDLLGFVAGDTITWHSGTTNAGTYWLQHPMQSTGTAMLIEGQHVDCWEIGKHKGKHDALVQCKPLTVYRDNDLDAISEETAMTETGNFGINQHGAHEDHESQNIDKWSAACLVRNKPEQQFEFIKACSESGRIYFTTTILKEF